MKILVLGGTGFLGPHVVRQLADAGHDITIFHTGGHEPDLPPQVRHVHSPSARIPISAIPAELTALSPDAVLHMGPEGERDAELVVDTFKGKAGRLVSISSQDVYRAYNRLRKVEPGPPDPLPLTENSPLREKLYPYREEAPRSDSDPQKYYDDYDKILVERAVMGEPQLPGTVLRLPMIYGPGDRQHRLFRYLKRMDDHRPAILLDQGHSQWRGPHGDVENVAWAISLAAIKDVAKGRIYNVAELESPSEAEWVGSIARAAGWVGRIVIVPPGRLPMPYDTRHHWVVDSSRIRRELGYDEPVPRDEALERTINWERANPLTDIDPAEFDYAAEDVILSELAVD
jgi:nucleoside-diphosphate-sugar epimerase